MFPVQSRRMLGVLLTAVGMGAATLAYAAEKSPRTDLYGDPLPPGALARLGTIRLRHVGMRIAFSADGNRLLRFSERDKTIRHWDRNIGQELRRIALSGAEGMKNVWSDWAGNTVVMRDRGPLVLWDADTGRERRRIEMGKNTLHTFALSPLGGTLAVAIAAEKGDTVRLWDTTSGKELHSLDHPQIVYELSFSHDGKLLGALTVNLDLHLWDTSTGKRLHTIPRAGRHIVFSPDGSKVAFVGLGNSKDVIKVWSMSEGRELAVMPKMEGVGYFSIRFSPDSKIVASGGSRDLLLFDIASRKLLRRIPSWGWIEFSPDGKTLASAGIVALHLWDTATGREISPRPGQDGPIHFLTATPDGSRITSLSVFDPIVYLWDATSGKSLAALPAGSHFRELHIGALSPDGKSFVSGGSDGKARVWDLDKAREVRQLSVEMKRSPAYENPVIIALSYQSGGNRLAAVSIAWHRIGGLRDKFQLDLWDLDTGKSLARRALPLESWPAVFTADGRNIVFRANDRLMVQDVATGRELAGLPREVREPFAWSADGQILAAVVYERKAASPAAPRASDPEPYDPRTIVLIELASGKTLRRIETGQSGLKHLAYSPDGRTLAGTVADGFRVWDIVTGKEIYHRTLQKGLPGYPFITSLIFLPDGRRLATGQQDGTVLVWDVQSETRPIGEKAADLDRLWADLASEDATQAHRAIWRLVANPSKAVPFIHKSTQPAAAPESRQLAQWIADLDSDTFAVREAAAVKLSSFGEQAEPALRCALEGKPSLEARKRLQALLADAEIAGHGIVRSREVLRTLRAIRVLEQIGDSSARQVLQILAGGDAAARTTRHATEALQRLQRRIAR